MRSRNSLDSMILAYALSFPPGAVRIINREEAPFPSGGRCSNCQTEVWKGYLFCSGKCCQEHKEKIKEENKNRQKLMKKAKKAKKK